VLTGHCTFVLPDHSGVQDYDHALLDGGHLLTMLGNAKWISYKQLKEARVKNGEIPAVDPSGHPHDR
jgi:hypothetical protein